MIEGGAVGAEDGRGRRPRLGFLGFPSDGTGRDPRSQGQILAAKFEAEGDDVRLASITRGRLRRLADQARAVVSWRTKVDVIVIDVFSGNSFVSAEVATQLARLVRLPRVLVLRGGMLPGFADAHPRRVQRTLGAATRIVAPSGFLGGHFADLGFSTVQIPNVVTPSNLAPRVRSSAQPRVLWMRTFEPIYQPLLAVRGFAELHARFPEATMTMAGSDHGELESTQALAAELGCASAISFAGYVETSRKEQAFADHDVFLNTTSVDNTPVSVLEAAAAGMPIVATDVGGLRAIVTDEESALLVPDGDALALGKALIRVCSDDELANRLSVNGLELSAGYTWPVVRRLWDALFEDMGLVSSAS